MQLKLRNFRGIQSADLRMDGLIALVCGRNAAGKTSVAQAAAALLTGTPIPLEALRKSDAGALVHSGGGGGEISLATDDGTAAISYPKARLESTGQPPQASEYAAGLRSVCDLPPKERASALTTYLDALPTRDDLAAALEPHGIPAEQINALWQQIEEAGWDSIHQQSRDKGVRMKGQWEEITGERYGSNKALKWAPAAWTPDLESASEESLQAQVTEAREWVEAAVGEQAISDQELARLRELAGRREETERSISEASAEAERLGDQIKAETTAKAALPSPDAGGNAVCPHCEGALHAKPDCTVAAAEALSDKERKQRTAAIEKAENSVTALHQQLRAATGARDEAQRTLAEIEQAEGRLGEQEDAGVGDAQSLEKARNAAQEAEVRLKAWQDKTRADKLAHSIGRNAGIVAALAPDGVRQAKLGQAVGTLNTALASLCESARWPLVEVGTDLSISVHATPWPLLSRSEQYRARVALQCVMADMDRSAAVVIDEADMLDEEGRNGLMRMLRTGGRPALVCMTMKQRDMVPVLAAKGMGRSYWLEGNLAAEVTG